MMIKFKLLQLNKMFNIAKVPRDQIIHRDHLITFAYETITKMRSQKTSSSCYQNPFHVSFARLYAGFFDFVNQMLLIFRLLTVPGSTSLRHEILPSNALIIKSKLFYSIRIVNISPV